MLNALRSYRKLFPAMHKLSLRALMLVLSIVVLFCFGQNAHGQTQVQVDEKRTGTAVLVDISGSMRFNAPNWRSEIRNSIEKFIAGGRLDESVWQVDGTADDEFVRDVRSGNPIHIPGQPLLVGHVGNVANTSPFVRTLDAVRPASPNDAADFLRGNLPREFDDQWTYPDVTLAVTRDTMLAQGAKRWYVLLVSDGEGRDPSPDPPESAMSFGNGYGTQTQQEKLLALSHTEDVGLQMTIHRVVSRKDPCEEDASLPLCGGLNPEDEAGSQTGKIALMVPNERKALDDGKPRFRWKASQGLNRFDLAIQDQEGNVQKRVRVARSSYTPDEPLSAGTYTWQVTGYGNTGSVQSGSQTFKVPGSGTFGTILLVLLVLAILGGGAYLLKQYLDRRRGSQRSSKESIDL